MGQITIKVHDVMHDAEDFSANEIERHMVQMCTDLRVDDVRLAKGHRNSPIFITLKEEVTHISMDDAKSIAGQMVSEFEQHVGSVETSRALRDSNIRIQQ